MSTILLETATLDELLSEIARRFGANARAEACWQSPVIDAVCEVVGISEQSLRSHRRNRTLSGARHLALVLLAKLNPERTQTEITNTFDLGHANLRYAQTRIDALCRNNPTFRDTVQRALVRADEMGAARCGKATRNDDLPPAAE
jgi:chromosomal replication initiation ATPase DnaA